MTANIHQDNERSETALIAFTTLVPAAFGMTVIGGVMYALVALLADGGLHDAGSMPIVDFRLALTAAAALVLATVGMVASVTHLAVIWRAPYSLRNLRSSWLSREILAVSVFWGFVLLWCACQVCALGVLPWVGALAEVAKALACAFCALAAVAGAVLMAIIARAYRVAPKPAWNGPESAWEMYAAAAGSGAACAMTCVFVCGIFQSQASENALYLAMTAVVLVICDAITTPLMHRRRIERLSKQKRNQRSVVTLARMDERKRAYGRAFGLIYASVALAALAFVLPAAWVAAALCQLIAHARLRFLFYETPANLRHVARIGKQVERS